ncbi:MAG: hypothetical protein KGY80_07395 [Candidatus Thorarchaeota archaeon]|nr:hypothetical protein [Candidatus Thorarchaeota archaeon]
MYRSEDSQLVVNPQEVVQTIRDANEFFTESRVDERYGNMALDLIRRYVAEEGMPRELDPFFAAALYLVSRHPWSHPNPLTKNEFAGKFRMKESSLEWYTESIVEKLDFIILHDKNHLPFFIDSQGTICSVMDSIVKMSVGEAVVKSIVRGSPVSSHELTERIVDQLCDVVKIIPPAFQHELRSVVRNRIETESERLIEDLGGRDAVF